jgi:hypothetical protein
VDQDAVGLPPAGRRRRAGVFLLKTRALQDSPLCPHRRRVPDDGDRQGSQGRHAGRDRPATRVVNAVRHRLVATIMRWIVPVNPNGGWLVGRDRRSAVADTAHRSQDPKARSDRSLGRPLRHPRPKY